MTSASFGSCFSRCAPSTGAGTVFTATSVLSSRPSTASMGAAASPWLMASARWPGLRAATVTRAPSAASRTASA